MAYLKKNSIALIVCLILTMALTCSCGLNANASLYKKGLKAIETGNYDEAVEALQKVVDNDATYKSSYALLSFSKAQVLYQNNISNNVEKPYDQPLNILNNISSNYEGDCSEEVLKFKEELYSIKDKDREEQLESERNQTEQDFEKCLAECPLKITKIIVTKNSINDNQLSVNCKNESDKTVDAFEIDFYCYDNYGKPVNKYVRDDNILHCISQKRIQPNGTFDGSNSYWNTYGYDNATQYEAYVVSVHYTDGTEWKVNDAFTKLVKEYTDNKFSGGN
ncbi:DUF5780 domain-containing protein [Butyrivibrio sp. AE3006]|uniref:DUF5780 domain-containing protein n=1 Tax=Butyrivibrio sp. AE3006 TaxID=1280673 RepID=UPI000410A13A|nr:DUF5780 domain-containing protein [Butyrivibrio sp. AE3006]